jgi:hypothetical protein
MATIDRSSKIGVGLIQCDCGEETRVLVFNAEFGFEKVARPIVREVVCEKCGKTYKATFQRDLSHKIEPVG